MLGGEVKGNKAVVTTSKRQEGNLGRATGVRKTQKKGKVITNRTPNKYTCIGPNQLLPFLLHTVYNAHTKWWEGDKVVTWAIGECSGRAGSTRVSGGEPQPGRRRPQYMQGNGRTEEPKYTVQ